MNIIEINNITNSDVSKKKLRILKDQKIIFPDEIKGQPETFDLNLKFDGFLINAKYTIGSKDGKSRSGVLSVGSDVYENILKIKAGSIVKIKKTSNEVYVIEKIK